MHSLNKYIISFAIFICLISSFDVLAKYDLKSIEFEKSIYQSPYLTYQQLLKNPKSEDTDDYLFWLLRKAQCEHLLYFFEEFEKTIDTTANMMDENSHPLIQSYVNFHFGIIYRGKGEYKKASHYFELALEKAKHAGLDRIYIQAKNENAYTQSLAELYQISLEDMQEAYERAYEIGDQFLIAYINETYGAIYGYMHDYQKSIEFYQKALKSYQELGYKAHIAEAIYGIASTYRYWGKFDLAIEYFKKYRQVLAYTPNEEINFYAAYGLGMTLAEQGSCEQALTIIDQALLKKGVLDYNSELFKNKAVCLLQLGRIDESILALNNAKKLFQQLPDLMGTSWQLETIKIESQIAQAKQNYQLSYQLLEDYYKQYTELLINNSSDRLLEVRTTLEQKRKEIEKDLELQRSQVASLKEQTVQQKYSLKLYFLIFLIVIILTIGWVQYRNNKKMHKLSMTDPLSGLKNRRFIFDFFNKLITTIETDQGKLSLILFDIDDFKSVNDQYGHPAGDFVIKTIAEIGLDVIRNSDALARIGGEEFLCVLPRTSVEQAQEISNRLLKAISKHNFQFDTNKAINITISIGIACYSQSSQSYNEIYTQADKALYLAKSQGKNCIVIANECMKNR